MKSRADSLDADLDKLKMAFSEISRLHDELSLQRDHSSEDLRWIFTCIRLVFRNINYIHGWKILVSYNYRTSAWIWWITTEWSKSTIGLDNTCVRLSRCAFWIPHFPYLSCAYYRLRKCLCRFISTKCRCQHLIHHICIRWPTMSLYQRSSWRSRGIRLAMVVICRLPQRRGYRARSLTFV